jgi:hypothetical protein
MSLSIGARQCHGAQEKSGSYRLVLPPLEVPVPT